MTAAVPTTINIVPGSRGVPAGPPPPPPPTTFPRSALHGRMVGVGGAENAGLENAGKKHVGKPNGVQYCTPCAVVFNRISDTDERVVQCHSKKVA